MGCRQSFLTCGINNYTGTDGEHREHTMIPQDRLCPVCYEEMLENLAHAIDHAYDPRQRNEWADCWKVLKRLYCWPLTNEVGN